MVNFLYRIDENDSNIVAVPDTANTVAGALDVTVTGVTTDINTCAVMVHKALALPINGVGPYTIAFGTLQTAFNGSTYAVATPTSTT